MAQNGGKDLLDRLAVRRRIFSLPLLRTIRSARRVGGVPLNRLLASGGHSDTGVVSLSAAAFGDLVEGDHRQALDELILRCASDLPWRSGIEMVNSEEMLASEPSLYRLGLNDRLLDLAETYLGGRCVYLGPLLKREAVNGAIAGTRQWHTDVEDDRVFRILIYLSPVAPGGGPFEFLSMDDTARLKRETRYRSGYLSDAWLRALVPWAREQSCLGGAGTAIVFDGAKVLHRASTPTDAERMSITLTYVRQAPLHIARTARLTRGARARLVASLAPRQRAAVPPARWF